MADAKKCDRCGKYYDSNAISHGPVWIGEYFTGLVITTDANNGDSFDLCDDCIGDLLYFLNYPTEKKKEK